MKPTGNLSLRKFCLLLLMMVSYTDTYVLAAPKGGRVVSGTASFQQDGNLTVVTAGNHSIINYGSFDIAAGETVRFVQPGANASVLNRVVGSANPTEIFGSLQANGHVFIVNPYGIFFRNGSVINVGSLYAGAGNLSDADFTKGKIHLTDLAGDVRNDGLLLADGHIALMGVNVVNTGSLKAGTGLATMVAGKDVYVGEKNGNIFVQANGGAAAGAAASGSVVNRGTVSAPRVLIGGGDLYSTAISNTGLLQGGTVVVNAGRGGTASIGGTIDATSGANRTADGHGGSIQVLGGTVALKGASLDASGANGGGSVRVGGDFHGGGTLAHAATTSVDAGTSLKADATGANGDGGTVVVWSDQATVFDGQASARGGAVSGHGGSAEVSSENALGFHGGVDLRAPGGTVGSLLLDPHSITVSDDAAATPIVGVPPTTTVGFGTTPATDLTISAASLGTALGTAAVTLQANTDITFNASVTAPAPTTGTGNLTLQAGRSILFTPTTANPAITLSLQGTLTATFNDGAIYQPGAVPPTDTTANRDAGAATFTMGAGSKIVAPAGVTIKGGDNTRSGDGTTTTVGTLNGNTGDITITNISTASATAGTASGNLDIEQNAGTTGKNIRVTGTLTTTPGAADTAAGDVTLVSTGNTSVAGIAGAGSGTGAGGTVSLGGVAAGAASAVTLNGAVTGNGLLDTGLTTLASGGTVTTGNAQQYTGGLSLGTAATLKAGGPISADSLTGNGFDLTATTPLATFGTITSGGNLTFNLGGPVGSAFTGPITATSLTTTGGRVNLSGGTITTSSATVGQNYGGEVRLAGNMTLSDTAKGPISFALLNGLVNGGGTGFTLKTDTGGTTTFVGSVGEMFPLGGLTVTGAANLQGGTVTTNGAAGQVYQNTVTLGPTGGTTTLGAGTGPIEFDAAVTGKAAGTQALALTTSGLQTFGGTVGSAAVPLASLTTGTGAVNLKGGGVYTSNGQTYNGAVTLNADTTLKASALTIPNFTGNSQNLHLTIGSNVTVGTGLFPGVKNFTSDGPSTTTIAGNFATQGSQTYGNPVTLATSATLTAGTVAGNANGISFTNTLDGPFALTLNTPGDEVFGGVVGGNFPLLSLTTDAAGTVKGQAKFSMDASTAGTVNPAGVNLVGGLKTNDGVLFAATNVSATHPTIQTGGAQDYKAAATLGAGTILKSTGLLTLGNITFESTLGGGFDLTLATPGTTEFDGTVGGGTGNALGSLTINGGGLGTTLKTTGVTTTGTQTYNTPLTLDTNVTLSSGSSDAAAGAITFNSTVQADGFSLTTATQGGNTVFGTNSGPVAGSLLGGLTTSALGSTVFDNAAFTTAGTQKYQGAVVVQSTSRALTLTSNQGNIEFDGAVTSTAAATSDLTVTANSDPSASTVTFKKPVGGGVASPGETALNSLTVNSPNINLNGGSVNTASSTPRGVAGDDGAQTYNGKVFLGADTTFVGSTVTATGGINAQTHSVTLTLSNLVTVPLGGGFTNLNSFTSNGQGGTKITGSFTTAGFQHYDNATTLGADATLNAGTVAGEDSIRFGSTLGSPTAAYNLTLNTTNAVAGGTPGPISFDGTVGAGSAPLRTLTTTNGTNFIDGGAVTTTGTQSYGGPVVFSFVPGQSATTPSLTTLTSNGGEILFNSTVDGDTAGLRSLTTNAAKDVVFANVVGKTALAALNANGTGTTFIEGGAVTTQGGGQTYQGPVRVQPASPTSTLANNTTLSDTNKGDLLFSSKLDDFAGAASTLTLSTGGNVTFQQAVGSGALGNLTASAGGTTFIKGGSVQSTGFQTYNNPNAALLGAVQLGSTTTVTALNGGAVTFHATVNGAADGGQGLTVNTGGNKVFDGLVGNSHPLANLTTAAGGQTQFNMAVGAGQAGVNVAGDVNIKGAVLFAAAGSTLDTPTVFTGGSQTYNGGTATQNTALVGNGGLTNLATLDLGGHDLELRFGKGVTVPGFFGKVGNFSSDGAGGTLINGTFNTAGSQTYGSQGHDSPVTLAGVPNLTANGDLTFNSTVDGGASLTLNAQGANARAVFNALVGNGTPLFGLTATTTGGTQFRMDAGTSKSGNGGVNVGAGGVTISGPVSFAAVNGTLADATHPTVVSGGGQTYLGAATLEADTGLVDTDDITFKSTVDGAFALAASTAGSEFFNGAVGGKTPLTGLTTDAPGVLAKAGGQAQFDFAVGADTQAGVRVNGNVAINDAATFHVDTSKVAGGVVTQPGVLTLNNGTQTYNGTVTLTDETSFVSTAGAPALGAAFTDGGQINFLSPVTSAGGAQNLFVRTGGGGTQLLGTVAANVLDLGGALVKFGGNVGPVNLFSVEPNGGGTGGSITLGGGGITTAGAQIYNTGLILGTDTTLTSLNTAGDGGNITFGGTVNSGITARALTVNTPGLTIFSQLVGNSSPLLSLTTDNEGKPGEGTRFKMDLTVPGTVAGVQVEGAVTINDPVLFGATGSTLAVPAILTGVLGGTGGQTYASAATLGQNTVLRDLAAANIRFGGTVDGTFDLSVNSGGDEIFGGLVGKTDPLASLETDQVGIARGAARFTMDLSPAGTVAGVRVNGAVNLQDSVEFAATGNGGTIPTVLSGGAQTYTTVLTGQKYTLGTTVTRDTILASTGTGTNGKLLFSTTVDGPAALTLDTGGVTEFDGAVGGLTALASLTTDQPGRTQINGGGVATTGGQTYGDAVLLGANTTISSGGKGAVFFGSTLNGAFALGVNTAGLTTFKGTVGNSAPLVSLQTVAPGAVEIDGGLVATTGGQDYGGDVTLGADTLLASSNAAGTGDVSFRSKLDGPFALTVNTAAEVLFTGPVGSSNPLASLATDAGGTTEIDGGTLTTTGAQTYGDTVNFTGNATLTSTNLGNLLFRAAVNGGNLLTLNTSGTTRFDDVVTLGSLLTDKGGTTRLNGGVVTSSGAQTYNDLVVLGANTTLASTAGGDLTFAQTLNGAFTLTLNTSGNTVFGGAVGDADPLASLTTDQGGSTQIKGGVVNTIGGQTFGDAVVLGADAVLASGKAGGLFFGNTVDGAFALTLNTGGVTTFGREVGATTALASLTTDGAGTTRINGGGVTTTGAQTYNDAVRIGADATLASLSGGTAAADGNLTFNSTVNGAFALTLNTGGLTVFNGVVGGTTALTGLTTDNAGAAGEETQFNMTVGPALAGVLVNGPVQINDAVRLNVTGGSLTQPGVLTLGDHGQAYNGPVRLGTSTYLTSATALPAAGAGFTGGGGIRFNGPDGISGVGGSDLFVRSAVGTTLLASTVSVGSLDLGGAQATFNGPVNLPGTLSVLPNDGGTNGSIEFAGGGLTTSGAQLYRVGVILGTNTTFTSLNTLNDGGNITFAGTVDSDSTATARTLTLNTSGDEIFRDLVGSRGALGGLTTDAVGPVGGTARFNMDLTGTPTGTAGVNVLGALTINDAARFNVAGVSLVDGSHPTILTGGAQIYNGAATLARDTALVGRAGGNLVFNASVDGASGLALSGAGNEVFNGLVGRQAALASLATDVTGPVGGQARFNMDSAGSGPGVNVLGAVLVNDGVLFNAANVALAGAPNGTVESGGTQTYGGPAVLARDTVLTSGAGNLVFKGTVDGAFGLATNSGGVHAFDGLIGSAAPLASLTTNGGGTQFNASLAGSGAAAGVRLDGPLTVNGTVAFNVAGSSATRPSVLTLGAAAQTYNGAATLARNTVLGSSGGGGLLFAATVDGTFDLTLNTAGVTTLGAALGGVAPLASLTTDAAGSTLLGAGTVLTVGAQTYGDLVNLSKTTLLTISGKGDLTFGSTVNGPFDLTVNSQGNEIFGGPVGNVVPLLSLTTDSLPGNRGGAATFNYAAGAGGPASVLTSGAQTYNDGLTLHAATTLTSANDAVTSALVTGQGSGLTVNAAAATFAGIADAGNLLFSVRGVTTFNDGIVGKTLAVAGGTLVNLNAGTVTTTAGGQSYGEPVTLQRETTLNTPLADAASNGVGVASLDGGGYKLTLNAGQATFGAITRGGDLVWTVAGTTVLDGTVDAASLSLNPTANDASATPAAVALNGGVVRTAGDQTFGGKITLGAGTRLTADAGTIKVAAVAGKGKDLTVSAARTVFNQIGNVGALAFTAARSVAVFDGAVTADSLRVAGDTQLNGGSISTGGGNAGQSYGKGVTLGAAANLTSTDGTISVAGVLTGNRQDLAVVAPTATFNRIDGTGATSLLVSGVTTFKGTVNADSLTVTGGRRLDLMTDSVVTTNSQEYDQPVNLAVPDGPAVALTSSSRDVTFGSTVNGARDLTVTTGGTAFFRGAVGGAANGALSSLTVNNAADVSGGVINTAGRQTYHGLVTVGTGEAGGTSLTSAADNLVFDRAVRGTSGDLNVRGVNVLLHDTANVSGGDLRLSATGSDASILQLDGSSYVSSGVVTFNDYTNLRTADLQKYSTIVLTNPNLVTVQGSGFRMGYEQKLLAAGSLNLNVGRGGTATVGDLAARQNLRVTAGTVDLLNRPAFTNSSLGVDSGLNFVARTTIDFGGARIQFLNPDNQTANFVTTNGNVTILRRTGLSIFRDPQVDTQFARGFPVAYAPAEGRFVSAFLPPAGLPEQPVGGGSQTLDTAAAISGALPDQKPLDVPVDVTITASQMEELRKLGIHPRKAQTRERGSFSSKEALFAQLVDGQDADNYGRLQPVKGGVSRLVPSDYVVVVDRMSEREVQAILQAFEKLYGKNKEKAPEIGAAYQKGFDEYSVAKQTADPVGFAPYLKDNPGKYPAVDSAARGFDNLFGYIEHMGLTPVEITKAETYIVSDLNVSGPTPEDMVNVINAQRKSLPPAQKAASTKVPPAPPVSGPAPAASPAPTPEPKKADTLKTVHQAERAGKRTAHQPRPTPPGGGGPRLAGL